MYNVFRYVIANEGVDTEQDYSFAGKVSYNTTHMLYYVKSISMCGNLFLLLQQFSCNYDKNCRGAGMTGVVQISKGSENSLLAAVATTGPVSVAVDGSSNAFRVRFQFYYKS